MVLLSIPILTRFREEGTGIPVSCASIRLRFALEFCCRSVGSGFLFELLLLAASCFKDACSFFQLLESSGVIVEDEMLSSHIVV